MATDCREAIMSEEYEDLIVPIESAGLEGRVCGQRIGAYMVEHIPFNGNPAIVSDLWYNTIPKLYGLLDTSSMEASGIIRVQNQPVLSLTGTGIIIGLIDTGIDYQNSLFRQPDGTTRVVSIWDQTIQEGTPPPGFLYGTEYTQEQIDKALQTENPLEIVPSQDEIGHGTFVSGIVAGGEAPDGSFIGAAPQATIAMVKLKPAKQYLKDFFFIQEDSIAYQENDIMAAVEYFHQLIGRLHQPIVICIGLGTNQGSHQGISPLSNIINRTASSIGSLIVIAAGNETGRGHHFQGEFMQGQEYEDVEIRVGEQESQRGFSLEFWGRAPEFYSISLRSPSGEVVPKIGARLGTSQVLDFIFEETRIYIDYRPIVQSTGAFSVLIRFQEPTQGVWTVRVFNSLYINGQYNIWLPIHGFISPETVFLRPNPNTTLTVPATSGNAMVAAAYNHVDGSIYLNSSRGFPLSGVIKPDLAAPGVDIYGPVLGNRFGRMTGTSIAAAHMAGAVALLLEWAFVQENWLSMNTGDAIAFFTRGAQRRPGMIYPNREWGYGTLDLYEVFESLRQLM